MTKLEWKQIDGSTLLRPWILDWAVTVRESSTIVKKSRKNYTCVLGCRISAGEKYARLELQAGEGYLTVGICQLHLSQFAGVDEKGWLDSLDAETFFVGLDSVG
jgi:hypothetical protein